MRKGFVTILFLLIANLLSNQLFSQSNNYDLYYNSENEMFCIGEDTLSYRFQNKGAFISYNYGIGSYSQKKTKLIIQHFDFNNITSKLVEVVDANQSDSVKLRVQRYDGSPIICSAVTITSLEKNDSLFINTNTDIDGCLWIDHRNINNDSIKVRIEMHALSFSGIQTFTLRKGWHYIVESSFPKNMGSGYSLDWTLKFIKFKCIDWNRIKIYDPRQNQWIIFKRAGQCSSCKEALFLQLSPHE